MAGQIDYTQIGYDQFFRKQTQQSAQASSDDNTALQVYENSPSAPSQDYSQDPNSLPQIPGNNVVGGILQSTNGNLTIDLNQGILNYNDGVQNLLTMSPTSGVNVNSSTGANLLSTTPSTG